MKRNGRQLKRIVKRPQTTRYSSRAETMKSMACKITKRSKPSWKMLKGETRLSIRSQMLRLLPDRQARRDWEAVSQQGSQVIRTSPNFPYKLAHHKSAAHIQKRRIVQGNLASAVLKVLQVEVLIVLGAAARRQLGPVMPMEAVWVAMAMSRPTMVQSSVWETSTH